MKLEEYISKYGNREVNEAELNKMLDLSTSYAIWKPVHGDEYFAAMSDGSVSRCTWNGSSCSDIGMYDMGNCYLTKEHANFAVNQQTFLTFMAREFAQHREDSICADARQPKYCLTYRYNGSVCEEYWTRMLTTSTRFVTTDRAFLLKFIEDYEDSIKKYYFEVKE